MRLNRVTANIIRAADFRERLIQQGAEPAGGAPDELDRLVRDDIAQWGKVVKALNLTADFYAPLPVCSPSRNSGFHHESPVLCCQS